MRPSSRSLSAMALALVSTMLTSPASGTTIDSLGALEFPNSGSPESQEAFVRGVLLLHSFEYDDAKESFREAQAIDPGFAMAYWGEAMTYNHPLWRQKDTEAALSALARLAPIAEERCDKAGTERECGYLEAVETLYGDGDKVALDLAYSEAMGKLSARYPQDLEAKSFYALSILGTTQAVRDFRVYMRAAAVVEEVFAVNPRHPGAVHYLIHSYDDPVHAPLGLRAARVYAEIAPAASHAQHMISHIYVALGLWAESVESNIEAFEVSRQRSESKGLGVDALNFHALHWLQYSYLQMGQFEEAHELLEKMHSYTLESDSPRARGYYSSMRASSLIEAGSSGAPPSIGTANMGRASAAADLFASGYRALTSGDSLGAVSAIEQLDTLLEEISAESTGKVRTERYQTLLVMTDLLKAETALEDGDVDKAMSLFEEATGIEQALPLQYGPPSIVKPSNELYGEVLLKIGQPAEASRQFQLALLRAPSRRQSLWGLAQASAALGDQKALATTCAALAGILAAADASVGFPPVCETPATKAARD